MKKSHIYIILVIGIAIAIIISTAGDASTYVNFGQAYQMAAAGNKKSIHVVGELKKDEHGQVTGLEETPDHVSCTFILVDDQQKEQKVFYNQPIPPDMTKSEKVVVIGKYQNDLFIADKILLKCPSKYQEQKLKASL
ncbi:MAG: cytochrome c maturation protein CcmE [Cyclobacteriaceae bacterium]|nr:cytochrome c maturation protein CcmE [Cyclobacteriaceae bacterium]